MTSFDGTWLKLRPTENRSSSTRQVPEPVLEDDRHLVGKPLDQLLRDVDAGRAAS